MATGLAITAGNVKKTLLKIRQIEDSFCSGLHVPKQMCMHVEQEVGQSVHVENEIARGIKHSSK